MTRVIQQATDDDSITVYGPVSVEAVSSDDKFITMEAVENALPQLLQSPENRLSVLHKDQLVGDVLPQADANPETAPNNTTSELVQHLNNRFNGLKTGVYEVTEPIAQAFPHLEERVGEDVFFAAATIRGDSQTARQAQEDAKNGDLDGFSLSGAPVEQQKIRHCDDDGCRRVTKIEEMDLSAITLGSRTDASQSPLAARVRNPGAAFEVVQQAGCCDSCGDSDTRVVVQQGNDLGEKVESCVKQVKEQGHDQGTAVAICRDAINEALDEAVAGYSDDEDEEDEEEQADSQHAGDAPGTSDEQVEQTDTMSNDDPEIEDLSVEELRQAHADGEVEKDDLLMELINRLESLEQEVAEQNATEEADDDEDTEVNVDVDEDDEDDEEEMEEAESEEQADDSEEQAEEPDSEDPDIEQLVTEKVEEALEQATTTVETPEPTGPEAPTQDKTPEDELAEAVMYGDTAKEHELVTTHLHGED